MAKRSYRTVEVNHVNVEKLLSEVGAQPVAVGVDVGKANFYAAIIAGDGGVLCTVKWKHPEQTLDFITLLAKLPRDNTRVALESTSRYGDILLRVCAKQALPCTA